MNIPKWIKVYAWIMAILPLVFSIVAYLDPAKLFPEISLLEGALILAGPFGLYLSRNIATGIATGFALIKNSASMVAVMLLLRFITDLIDFIVLYVTTGQYFPYLLIWIIIFWVPSLWGLKVLTSKTK